MTKIVGVRFQRAGKIYYFDPVDLDLDMAMHVIVETARGMEMGTVLIPPKEVEDDSIVSPLKPVIRVATDEDERLMEYNKGREKEAFDICKKKILEHELEMKLVAAEYTFDGSKLLFYFTADGRIDFRELVKDLASVFRTRIELRQIGVRDETKMMGGIGICGRPLCCSLWLSDFVPVSIKMAKEQNLSLNPAKISGVCGRLMCCLKNEQDTYEYLNSMLPNVGDVVQVADGTKGQVSSVNVLRQTIRIIVDNGDEKEMKEYSVKDIGGHPHHKKETRLTEEEIKAMKELESLEDNDNKSYEERKKKEKREGREKRGNREEREPRQPREERAPREERQPREDRVPAEERQPREPRQPRQPRQPREERTPREERQPREDRNRGEERQPREPRQPRQPRQPREDRFPREERQPREERAPREERQSREERTPREEREPRQPKEGGFRRRNRYRGNASGEENGNDRQPES